MKKCACEGKSNLQFWHALESSRLAKGLPLLKFSLLDPKLGAELRP